MSQGWMRTRDDARRQASSAPAACHAFPSSSVHLPSFLLLSAPSTSLRTLSRLPHERQRRQRCAPGYRLSAPQPDPARGAKRSQSCAMLGTAHDTHARTAIGHTTPAHSLPMKVDDDAALALHHHVSPLLLCARRCRKKEACETGQPYSFSLSFI